MNVEPIHGHQPHVEPLSSVKGRLPTFAEVLTEHRSFESQEHRGSGCGFGGWRQQSYLSPTSQSALRPLHLIPASLVFCFTCHLSVTYVRHNISRLLQRQPHGPPVLTRRWLLHMLPLSTTFPEAIRKQTESSRPVIAQFISFSLAIQSTNELPLFYRSDQRRACAGDVMLKLPRELLMAFPFVCCSLPGVSLRIDHILQLQHAPSSGGSSST